MGFNRGSTVGRDREDRDQRPPDDPGKPQQADAGIGIDGAGIGSAIAANKIDGIRAVMATTELIARYSREHNGANVLSLGSTLLSQDEATAIVSTWLSTPMREPRYMRRLAKIRDLERRS